MSAGTCNRGASIANVDTLTLFDPAAPATAAIAVRPAARTDSAVDDAALVRRAQAGEREAFIGLYRRYVDEIFGYAYRQLGDVQDAEDVTSETFLRLVTGLDGFDLRSSFRTWLYTIARNQLRDRWRAQGRRPRFVPIDDEDGSAEDDVVDGWNLLAAGARDDDGAAAAAIDEASSRWAALGRQVMAALPANYRLVLTLRVAQGRSVRDVAEIMGTTPGNVKVLQHRALKRAAALAATLEAGDIPTHAPAGRRR